jgi:hypothetical protein
MYRILIHSTSPVLNNPDWHDCGEGPFDTAEEATAFARAEVGAGWIIVDAEGRPVAYGDALGVKFHRAKRSVGLDPFGLSHTTTLGNMKLEICDTWYEHLDEHADLAIRGNLSLNVAVGIVRGLEDEDLGSFAFCPHCGILQLSRQVEFCTRGEALAD